MKILVLDNYDSFTYNLVYLLRELGHGENLDVVRNDKIKLEDVDRYDRIMLSPGPGIPKEAGMMMDIIQAYAPKKSILGICLGHQGIAEAFGASLYNMPEVLHGIEGRVKVTDQEELLFAGLPAEFTIGHYHSWSVVPETVNGELMVTATDGAGRVMGIRHRKYDVHGLQFHPESVLTQHGKEIIKNWIEA